MQREAASIVRLGWLGQDMESCRGRRPERETAVDPTLVAAGGGHPNYTENQVGGLGARHEC